MHAGVQVNYRASGETFWMQTSVTPARLHGRVTHHIWVHTDITQQKVLPCPPSGTAASGFRAMTLKPEKPQLASSFASLGGQENLPWAPRQRKVCCGRLASVSFSAPFRVQVIKP